MDIKVDRTGTVTGFLSIMEEMAADKNNKGLLVLACDANGFTPEAVDGCLKKVKLPLFGGVFPAIIHEREKMNTGTIIVGLKEEPVVYTIPNLSDINRDFDGVIESLIPEIGEANTMFVFVDGYSQQIMPMIDSLYTIWGVELNFLGGGAGSINPTALDMKNTPCLFTNDGLVQDAALLALVTMKSGIGAGHGWHKISGPYKVTESTGNVIKTLNLQPAFQVYREIIEQHSGKVITADNFFDVGKYYPFGIHRLESEVIVRDPYTVEGDSLVIATPIPSESFVDILSGDTDSVVDAARQSFSAGMQSFGGGEIQIVFMVDCISRVLFLGDEFEREIEAVTKADTPLIGVLSLGEIANSGSDYMELYNKTCVVGILGD